ncbi:MAG: trafficking protein particle complex II-specific subunit 120 [Magnetococcus sp. DMHC-6]
MDLNITTADDLFERVRHILYQEPERINFELILALDQMIQKIRESAKQQKKSPQEATQEARILLQDANLLLDLPPVCYHILRTARQFAESGNTVTHLDLLRKALTFAPSPAPQPLRRLLATAMTQQAISALEGITEESLTNKYVDHPSLPFLDTALGQLEAALKLNPTDPLIEAALLKAHKLAAKVEEQQKKLGSATASRQKRSPSTLDPEGVLSIPDLSPEILASFSQKAKKSQTYRKTILLAFFLIGLVFVGYDKIGPQQFLQLVNVDIQSVPQTAPTAPQKNDDAQPASVAASGQPPLANSAAVPIDLPIPAPKEGISTEEALKKIEKMGVQVPNNLSPGQAPAPSSSAAPLDLPIPAPREGISMEEALKKINQFGVQAPGGQSSGAAPAGDYPTAAISGGNGALETPPKEGLSVEKVLQHIENSGTGTQPPPVPTSSGVGTGSNSASHAVTSEAGGKVTEKEKASASPAKIASSSIPLNKKEALAQPPENNSSPTTTANPWRTFVGQAVLVTLTDGNRFPAFLKEVTDAQLHLTRTPDDPGLAEIILLDQVRKVETADDIYALYMGTNVQVITKNGFTKKGLLKKMDSHKLFLDKTVFGGSLQFEIERSNIKEIQLIP